MLTIMKVTLLCIFLYQIMVITSPVYVDTLQRNLKQFQNKDILASIFLCKDSGLITIPKDHILIGNEYDYLI